MLTRMLCKAVETNPAKAALVQGSRRICYDDFLALTGRCAAGLRRLGIGAGDCVAVVLPNRPEFVASLFACARVGAVMLPIDPREAAGERSRLLQHCRVKVVVVDSVHADSFAETKATVVDFAALLPYPADPLSADPLSGPVLWLCTSGSTDSRKLLCCSQENLYYEALNFVETVGLTSADNILCTIPLHHSYGLGNCILDAVYAGSTLVLMEAEDAPFAFHCRRVLERIREEAIAFFPGVPYQFQLLAALPDAPPNALKSLRLCVSSGDVLPCRTYQRFLERFGAPIRSLYGSTEAGSICLNTDPLERMQFGSLGPPLKNVTIRIRDEAGRDLAPNECGQIWVRSPAIPATGYDNQPALTAQVFRDGYYKTGDLGMLNARGHLVMTGRKQTFLDVGGYKVDIVEVEEVLQSHPQVCEAAVLGVEVPHVGTLIKAVVVTDGLCGEADILSYCRQHLVRFKVPRLIEFRSELPRSPMGKVLKSELGNTAAYLPDVDPVEFERAWQKAARKGRAQQIELLATHLQQQAALTLQREPKSISRSAPFLSMGFDSIRAAELYQRLLKLTGLPLSITMLWNFPTIDELAAALWSLWYESPRDGKEPTAANTHDLADLSRYEIAELLASELSNLEGNPDDYNQVVRRTSPYDEGAFGDTRAAHQAG
jgi:long-chain acyl-CoA synthetase